MCLVKISRGCYANLLGMSDERGIWNRESCTNGCDHTSTNTPDPIRTPQLSVLGREFINSAVKRAWARVVLGWVTSREVLVLNPFFIYFFAI
ncbi:hypothetical protein N665_0339s0019 [Sinapis alba]|nr:hypothetical protein N665_0339s0019 [Sinapis alba]